ncbi:30S ribosomal protein S11 [Patescibacteria group bacterium]|nr:30S ribosomal protein S11 [Patescibacteria group bacterium]HOM78146.1 30S ribosomal protein S11 [bacterium]
MAQVASKTKKKNKAKKITETGKVYIYAGFNNTLITITDPEGNALFSGSAGASGFKGSRKSTPFAASAAAEELGKKAVAAGMSEVSVIVKGPGYGRISAIKSLKTAGLSVVSISDVTPIPHNGCRPKKIRRV